MMEYGKYVLIAIIGYLLGSMSMAVLLTRDKSGRDVRDQGSGNAGATNVARVYGMKAGFLTLGGDMAKTALSGLAGFLIAGRPGLAVASLACVAGHCWPVYFRFKGGKGISVAGCIALLFDWRMFLLIVAWFLVTAFLSRRVSFGSVTAALVYPLAYWLPTRALDICFAVSLIIAVIAIFQHRGNIKRLIRGEEPAFKPKS